jgi:hypothetical protein
MRVGDFSVEVVAHHGGRVRELESGQVLARPGQVYRLRLRNHGPLRAVVRVDIDGKSVMDSGLVLRPWSVTELERPLRDGEHGRFTVIAEGNERVFGPDGGRDNEALGVIKAAFRRELPASPSREDDFVDDVLSFNRIAGRSLDPEPSRRPSRFSRDWSPPMNAAGAGAPSVDRIPAQQRRIVEQEIEGAAGTGLSGHSDQEFVPIHLGPLENEATIIALRIVIGSEEAIAEEAPRPLHSQRVPERPAARP